MNSKSIRLGILTVCGEDQVGVAATGSGYLTSKNASIREEWGIVVANHGYVHTLFNAENYDYRDIVSTYKNELHKLSPQLVEITARDVQNSMDDHEAIRYEMDVWARDRIGIIAEIEIRLAALSVNVQEVRGRSFGPPEEGTYVGSFDLEIPNAPAVRKMRQMVRELEAERHWTIDLRPASGVKRMGTAFMCNIVSPKRGFNFNQNEVIKPRFPRIRWEQDWGF